MTVVVSTFGDPKWITLAAERAIPSAEALGVPVVHSHDDTLDLARNNGAGLAMTEWLCFLDADDELEAGYFDEMAKADADLRAPLVRYVTDDHAPEARWPRVWGHNHDCEAECLAFGNYMVIGTLVRADLFRQVGGFRNFAWSEDWDLWVRCWHAGATVERTEAVYRAHVRPDSRNRAPLAEFKLAQHRAIARLNGLPIPA